MYDAFEAHRLIGPALERLAPTHLAIEVVLPRRMRPVTACTHLPRSVARLILGGLPKC